MFEDMKTTTLPPFSIKILRIPIAFILGIWFIYWVEIRFGLNFTKYGVLPRNLTGLKGVVFAPFIHSGPNHLFNNSVPLGVLLTALVYFYRDVYLRILIVGGVCTGLVTWMIAREAYHIGASGLVYLLFSFVFFSGVLKKQYQLVAVSLIVIFLYGSMIWYVFPIKEGVSWEGHLAGFTVGLFFAVFYRKKGIVKEAFEFTQTDFDLLFDAEGNFNPPQREEDEEAMDLETPQSTEESST